VECVGEGAAVLGGAEGEAGAEDLEQAAAQRGGGRAAGAGLAVGRDGEGDLVLEDVEEWMLFKTFVGGGADLRFDLLAGARVVEGECGDFAGGGSAAGGRLGFLRGASPGGRSTTDGSAGGVIVGVTIGGGAGGVGFAAGAAIGLRSIGVGAVRVARIQAIEIAVTTIKSIAATRGLRGGGAGRGGGRTRSARSAMLAALVVSGMRCTGGARVGGSTIGAGALSRGARACESSAAVR
jgi:hypothetical protein